MAEVVARSVKPMWQFLGGVVLVGALWAARDVLIPIALAALLTFILTPPVTWLERRIGRVPAVLGVVTVVFLVLIGSGWVLTLQLSQLTDDLPRYRKTLVTKISELRHAGEGNAVDDLTEAVKGVQEDLKKSASSPADRKPPPVVVLSENVEGLSVFGWLGPLVGMVTTAALVTTLVIFMLLERRHLRERFLTVVGQGRLALTTRALDEAGSRVARQLLMQTLVNGAYGIMSAIGLTVLDVPHALVWAALGAVLRFVPYVGPVVGAVVPTLIAVAALDGWRGPAMVAGFYIVLELFTNLVLETVLYADAAGVSQVGLLVSVTFWTWLWGPLGLLMAVPLTVCVVVMGKHVPGLGPIAMLLADSSPLSASHAYYQRLLARDTGDATDLIEKHIATAAPRTIYDALIVPALGMAVLDRLENRLTPDEEASIVATTRELLGDTADAVRRAEAAADVPRAEPEALARIAPLRVLGFPVGNTAEELALEILAKAVDDLPVAIEITPRLLTSELAAWTASHGITVVCIADLPPNAPSRSRYLVKKLRAFSPDLRITVGRWATPAMADDSTEMLMAAGANHVASTMEQSRAYLRELASLQRALEVAAGDAGGTDEPVEPVEPVPVPMQVPVVARRPGGSALRPRPRPAATSVTQRAPASPSRLAQE